MRRPPSRSDVPMHGWAPYSDMHHERIRAHNKFKDHPKGSQESLDWRHNSWPRVVMEELGEAVAEVNDLELGVHTLEEAADRLIKELVQTGAMVAAWIDAIEDWKTKERNGW